MPSSHSDRDLNIGWPAGFHPDRDPDAHLLLRHIAGTQLTEFRVEWSPTLGARRRVQPESASVLMALEDVHALSDLLARWAAAVEASRDDTWTTCTFCGGDGGDVDDSTKNCDECGGRGVVPVSGVPSEEPPSFSPALLDAALEAAGDPPAEDPVDA